MPEYSEKAKQDIGELVLMIRDLEEELKRQKSAGENLVRPLRALADFFDPDNRGVTLVRVGEDYFSTTHPINRHREGRTLSDGKRSYPSFPFPDSYKETLRAIHGLESKLDQLKKELEQAKQRAQKQYC
ncbi:MAG: hypothetical protein OXH73_13655 [Caldilineaceae bacterium]|nr:hypothetical protein [Caldilineaceae bacterium]